MSAFFSTLSPEARILLGIAALWLSGFLMSRVTKAFSLPNVTGYILAGVAIGPYCLNLLPPELTRGMSFMTDAALAMIAFGVGRYLSMDRLKGQGGKIILLTLMESLVAAVIVTAVMLLVFRLPLSFSLLLGAIASATAPASSLMTIRQYRAKGVFVNTLIQVVALDDAVSLLAFSLCAAIAGQAESAGESSLRSVLMPVAINIGVILAAYLLGRLLVTLLNGRSNDHRIIITMAFIFLLAGGCAALDVSPLLGCMVLGATWANLTHDKLLFKQISRVQPPITMMFFVLSGMRLNIGALATAGVIGVTYFAVRIGGKYLGAWLGARLTGMAREVRRYLGLALIPQAGVSIGLAVLAQRILPEETGSMLSTIILSSSVLYEMIGPLCAKRALFLSGAIRAGEAPQADAADTSAEGVKKNGSAVLPAGKGSGTAEEPASPPREKEPKPPKRNTPEATPNGKGPKAPSNATEVHPKGKGPKAPPLYGERGDELGVPGGTLAVGRFFHRKKQEED